MIYSFGGSWANNLCSLNWSFPGNSPLHISQIILGTFLMWVTSWIWSLSFRLKNCPHTLHWYDFLAWRLSMCLLNVNFLSNSFPHILHWKLKDSLESFMPGIMVSFLLKLCSFLSCWSKLSRLLSFLVQILQAYSVCSTKCLFFECPSKLLLDEKFWLHSSQV